jgi:hypothetical protein
MTYKGWKITKELAVVATRDHEQFVAKTVKEAKWWIRRLP